MKRSDVSTIRTMTAVALPLILLCLPAATLGSTLYRLVERSAYEEGCFDPCMCPIMFNETLRGTFAVEPLAGEVGAAGLRISEVHWNFVQGTDVVAVTGSGLYTREPLQHRLELDLQLGDQPPQRFDSGLVALSGEFPTLSIAVAVNGFFCYDRAFVIEAEPNAVGLQTATWGALKSTYR